MFMGHSIEQKFLSDIILTTSMLAKSIERALAKNEQKKTQDLLNIMTNYTLIPTLIQTPSASERLVFFQKLLNDLPYSELDELKNIINLTLAKIKAHKDLPC